jgi:hypothetical protein
MGTNAYVRVRQDRPSDLTEVRAEVVTLIKKLAMGQLSEPNAAQYVGRLRYIVGRWG